MCVMIKLPSRPWRNVITPSLQLRPGPPKIYFLLTVEHHPRCPPRAIYPSATAPLICLLESSYDVLDHPLLHLIRPAPG
jgi:hypothetical protein